MNYKKTLFSALAIVSLLSFNPARAAAPTFGALTATVVSPSTPTQILIPTGNVNAHIIDVGITKDGKLDVPPNYTEVGWYKYGTRPGEMGSAVLDGHVDNGGMIPGPFKNLRTVKNGDDIYVTMSDGSILHYAVLVSEVYALEKFPAEKVFHETGKQYLKIITCHGKYVPSIKTYNQRLIVTAVLVP